MIAAFRLPRLARRDGRLAQQSAGTQGGGLRPAKAHDRCGCGRRHNTCGCSTERPEMKPLDGAVSGGSSSTVKLQGMIEIVLDGAFHLPS